MISVWIRHKGINETVSLESLFFDSDKKTLCIDCNGGKSQINIMPLKKQYLLFLKSLLDEAIKDKNWK